MSSARSFLSFDGLTESIQVADALIDEYNVELSTVQAAINRIMEEQNERHKALLLSTVTMRGELVRQMQDVEQLETEFNARRVPFEDEIRSIQAKIDGVKATIAPIRKLPAEILGNIFREVVRHGVPPWVLATVSRSWRITSLTTPSLWSNLYVGILDIRYGTPARWIVDGEPRYTSANRVLCRTLDELAYYAERSGAVPLDVLIDSRLAGDQDEVLQGLLGESYSSRISFLSLSNSKTKEDMADWMIGLSLIEEIHGVPKPWPNESTPNVTLEHIKSITLLCPLECLARLRLPRLEKLYWSGTNVILTHPNYSSGATRWNLSFPNVVWFEASAAGDTFEAALKYLPNVQTVFIKSNTTEDNRDAWALNLLKNLASVDNMLCPQIRRLTVGTNASRVSTSKTLANPIIRRLIRSRVELGIPLEHFEISWTRRSGKDPETVQYI